MIFLRLVSLGCCVVLASCASAESDDSENGTMPPVPADARGTSDFPDGSLLPDAAPIPDARSAAPDAMPPAADASFMCTDSSTCGSGKCCFSSLCVPGQELLGNCIPLAGT